MKIEKYRRGVAAVFIGICLTVALSACSRSGSTGGTAPVETTQSQNDGSEKIKMDYDLTIKAVVLKADTQAGIVQLQNTAGGSAYTLVYTDGTVVLDKYGSNRLMDQVQTGDLVQAYIDEDEDRLAGLVYSKDNWNFEDSTNWKFDTEKKELIIGKDKYYYSDDLVLLSDGEPINFMDLNKSDVLTIWGSGKKALSVNVTQGHGFVDLNGIEDFIGGWVEIGKVIKPISEDMLIVVPEGNWDVTVVKDGYGGSIGVTVERNQEVAVDFTEVANKIVRYGAVEFTIEPADAKLYIAGREVDYSSQILLEYDTYKIRVSADGYQDYTGDLKVNKALIGRKITLDKTATAEAATTTPSATAAVTQATQSAAEASSSPQEGKTITGYKIEVESPSGVSVYFDDTYVGIAPVSFTKVSGTHTITLSKSGYTTKSYSVDITAEEKDVTFALPELEHEK